MRFATLRPWTRAVAGALVPAVAGYVVLWRRGGGEPRYGLLLALAAALALSLAASAAFALAAAARGPARFAPAAEAATALGLLLVLAGGVTNLALGIYGAALVFEREPIRLSARADLAALQTGPLASKRDLDIVLALDHLELQPAGGARFSATSKLKVMDSSGAERGFAISGDRQVRYGAFDFLQGVWGFAPRVVVLRGRDAMLDEFVPFRTVREGADGVSFVGDFEVTRERLLVHGAVTLDALNDDMKGHPRLELVVERDGARLGQGTLRPGEYVDLEPGLKIGFAGLKRWSEVMFTRHRYRRTVLAGAALAALGLLAWAAAGVATWWRRA